MDSKDYLMEASLYYKKSMRPKHAALVFRRFDTASEAIRFVMEDLDSKALHGCSLEINGANYFGREILALYDDRAFPLPRSANKKRVP